MLPHLSCASGVTLSSVLNLSILISSSVYLFLQEEKGISCGLVDLDFLKCSVGFPFMRAQTKVAHTDKTQMHQTHTCMQMQKLLTGCKSHHTSTFFCPQYHFAVIFDTSRLSGENDTLQFLVQAKR